MLAFVLSLGCFRPQRILRSMIDLMRRLVPRTLRNWIRQPRRSVRYVLHRSAYAFQGASAQELRPDWSLRCHPASREHFTVFNSDLAQRTELDLFIRYCRTGMQFLDVGAHYGLFALAAHRFSGTSARVACVEPSPKAAQILRANLDANEVRNVSLLNVAMGASDGFLEMLSTGPAGSDYFASVPTGRSDTVTVRQLTMSSVLCQTGLLPTHVKIDVEGFEDDVIAGALKVLREHHPILFLELHGSRLRARQRDPALVITRLRQCGYERIEEAGAEMSDDAIAGRDFECRLVCF